MIDSIVKYVVGKLRLIGNSDGTLIGNYLDAIKTVQPDLTATGTITTSGTGVGSYVELALQGSGSAQALISGTFTGATLLVEGTVDGVLWNTLYVATGSGGTYAPTTFSTAAKYRIYRVAGLSKIRVRATALASGSVSVILRATVGVNWLESLMSGQYKSSLPTLEDGGYGPVQLDQNGRILISGNVSISTLPAVNLTYLNSINAGVTVFSSYTASQRLAIKIFYAGGKGLARQVLYKYVSSTISYVNGGTFENAGDVGTTWVWSSAGGTGSIAQSSAQVYAGTYSCQLTYSNSSGNNAQSVVQTFSSSVDYSLWKSITAQFYNVPPAGGAVTRTISLVLTDANGSTRTWSLSGRTDAAPFNASGWNQVGGDLLNPTTSSGIEFDLTSITSIALTLNDSGNKAGTAYWDTVKLSGALSSPLPIYHLANESRPITIDPVITLEVGDQILVAQTNNDTARKELFALVGTVAL